MSKRFCKTSIEGICYVVHLEKDEGASNNDFKNAAASAVANVISGDLPILSPGSFTLVDHPASDPDVTRISEMEPLGTKTNDCLGVLRDKQAG